MEPYWEVLLMHLVNFRFVYPPEREAIPRWLFDELVDRLNAQAGAAGAADQGLPRPALLRHRLSHRRPRMGLRRRRRQGFAVVRVAGLGDLHAGRTPEQAIRDLFREIAGEADVLALCGDLTNLGKAGEAETLAEELAGCRIPRSPCLGNHDYECGNPRR